jgi:hypothetical protein
MVVVTTPPSVVSTTARAVCAFIGRRHLRRRAGSFCRGREWRWEYCARMLFERTGDYSGAVLPPRLIVQHRRVHDDLLSRPTTIITGAAAPTGTIFAIAANLATASATTAAAATTTASPFAIPTTTVRAAAAAAGVVPVDGFAHGRQRDEVEGGTAANAEHWADAIGRVPQQPLQRGVDPGSVAIRVREVQRVCNAPSPRPQEPPGIRSPARKQYRRAFMCDKRARGRAGRGITR